MKEYILITGASSGIGYEMARQLAALKYNLILTARSEDKLKAMQSECLQNMELPCNVETSLEEELNMIDLNISSR